MNLRAADVVAGWTAAQWVTVLKSGGVPTLGSHAAALNFRLQYLETRDAPVPYKGSDLEIELLEVSLILGWAK